MTDLNAMTAHGGTEGSSDTDAPYVPPTQPVATASPLDGGSAAPYLPPAQPIVAEPAPQPEFDAKAMVESQKRYNPNPAYGAMPQGTQDGFEAARRLREKANRKKRRARMLGRIVMLLVLAGLGVGGFFVYQAVRDSQNDDAVTTTEASDANDLGPDGDAPAGATPLGGLVDSLEAQDALNDTPVPRAGGFLDAIDGAREVVAEINGDAAGEAAEPADGPTPAAVPFVEGDVVPFVLEAVSEQLPVENGFERHVIDGDAFEAANVGAFERFVEVAVAQPQVESPAFLVFPELGPTEIGLALQRVDDELSRVVIVTADRSLSVDVTL